jgi:hypothetical protein
VIERCEVLIFFFIELRSDNVKLIEVALFRVNSVKAELSFGNIQQKQSGTLPILNISKHAHAGKYSQFRLK